MDITTMAVAMNATKEWTKTFFSPFSLTEDGYLKIDMRSEIVKLDKNGVLSIFVKEDE